MKPARAFLQLVLSVFLVAALVVSSGFAATKKLDRHRLASEEWNDTPLMSATLLSRGSSVPSDGSSTLTLGSLQSSPLVSCPDGMDCWNGGTGNWSVPGNWSPGEPGASSDVTIYSGGNDTVTLDTSPTISSLVLGGASNGTTSELTDGGVAQTLAISNGLTVGQTGYLQLTGGSTITVGTDSNNAGEVDIQNGSHLSIAGNLNNQNSGGNPPYIYVFTGSVLSVAGDFDNQGSVETGAIGGGSQINVTGTLTNEGDAAVQIFGPGDSASIGKLVNNGFFYIDSGPIQATTVGSLSSGATGFIDLENGSKLTVNGDVNNSGTLGASLNSGTGSNTITINGTLTNNSGGTFSLNGTGDVGNVGTLNNSGYVFIGAGATLSLTNQLGGITDVAAGSRIDVLGNFNDFLGGTSALANLSSVEGTVILANGQTTEMADTGRLYINQGGTLDASLGSTIHVGTDVEIDGGLLATGSYYGGGNNTIKVEGDLVNGEGNVFLYGNGDMIEVDGDIANQGVGQIGLNGSNQTLFSGQLNNEGSITLNGPNDTATIGSVTNSGKFELLGFGDVATLGSLTNSGAVDVDGASTLQINGDVSNSGFFYTSFNHTGGNTLNITGTLTNNNGGHFYLQGNGDVANVGMVDNFGLVSVQGDTTLNLTNQPNGVTDVVAGSTWVIGGNFAVAGAANTGFANLTSVEGSVDLGNRQATNITPGGGVLTVSSGGGIDVNTAGTSLQINGDVNNSGRVSTSYDDRGGVTLTVTGTLTNNPGGDFSMGKANVHGNVDAAYLGGLVNNGTVELYNGSALTITGDATNSGTITTDPGANTLTITGTLHNNSGGSFVLYGPGDEATIGKMGNAGLIDLENASSLTVTGDSNNEGNIYTSFYKGSGGNTITIDGTLFNGPSAVVSLLNPTDKLIINGSMGLSGGAAVSTPTLNNGGFIGVDSVSTLLVGLGPSSGLRYAQLANGTLGEIINSYSSYGTITVGGSALLGGTLDILLKPGFNPTLGSTFQIFSSYPGALFGSFEYIENDTFNNGTEYLEPLYYYDSGELELIAKPVAEPAALLVLIPGLLGMGYGLRRKLLQ